MQLSFIKQTILLQSKTGMLEEEASGAYQNLTIQA
jgi:hypothetical protein